MHKHKHKTIIVNQLVDEDVLPDTCVDMNKPLPVEPSGHFEIMRLEIERKTDSKSLNLKLNNEKSARSSKEHVHLREMKALKHSTCLIVHKEPIESKFDLVKNV